MSQREVGVHSPSFASALHSALREDPDAILVGELRDLETMSIAMTAAEMGVLVMGTLHTNGAAATIDRVVNIFPADKQDHVRNMLSTSLRGIVSQQLLKKKDGTGRAVALEILINTSAAANLIRQGKLEQLENVMQSSGREGMCTMDGSIKKLYEDGVDHRRRGVLERLRQSRSSSSSKTPDLAPPRPRGIMAARQQRTLPIQVAEPSSLSVKRTILVTSALPYANDSLHLGHVLGYVQTDIWVRFQRLRGHRCLYVCASDAHGTPTMLRAEQEGIAPEALVARVTAEHARDFATYRISVDNYLTTHSPENEELTTELYRRLAAGGFIARKTIKQAYDEQRQMFLPDRYVRGTCPNCGAPDQYGDSCENCGATYSPLELKDAVSTVSGTPPTVRESEHLFLKLERVRGRAARAGCPSTSTPCSRASSTSGSRRGSRTGTSRATRRTSASASPASATNTSTCGSTRRSATWRAS